jgi:hypothetical protein
MIEGNGYSLSDNIRNISISQPSLAKYNSQELNSNKHLKFEDRLDDRTEVEGEVKLLYSNISFCNISRIDIALKDMHKRWSMID